MIALDELVIKVRDYADLAVTDMQPETIAEALVTLASYRVSLGQYVAKLERLANLAEAHYEQTREIAYRDSRNDNATVADSDNAKRLGAEQERQAWIKAHYEYRTVSNLWRDSENLLDAMRSKLSYKKSERRD